MEEREDVGQPNITEMPDGDYSGSSAQTGAAQPSGTESVIEFDPDAFNVDTPISPSAAAPQSSVDTLIPHDDFFQARDELEQRLGGLNAIASAFSTATPDVTGKENIVGYGVGLKLSAGTVTGEMAVKVFVREKLATRRLSADALIPPQIAGVTTDVEDIGDVLPQNFTQRFPRPVPCGVSISNIGLPGSGTLGCLVVLDNNKLCLLSNNHVIANENAAQIGSAIIQPGRGERVPAADEVIAVLERFVPIQAFGNSVDAAVGWTSNTRVRPEHVTYRVNPQPLAATIGMSVIKNGRTTQSTVGMVTDVGVVIRVGYTPFPAGAEMRNQVAIRGVNGPFSKPGDSGSLIVTANSKQPVALLFAGSTDNKVTFANPIAAVMAALGINRFV